MRREHGVWIYAANAIANSAQLKLVQERQHAVCQSSPQHWLAELSHRGDRWHRRGNKSAASPRLLY